MLDRQFARGTSTDDRRAPVAGPVLAPSVVVPDRIAAAELPAAIPAIGFSVLGLASTIERWTHSNSEAR